MTIKQSIMLVIGGFVALLGINTFVGLSASQKLGGLLDYISGPAWNAADGAMEGQIGLEAQIIALQKLYHAENSFSQLESQLNDAIAMENEALTRMKASGLMSATTVSTLNQQLENYHRTRTALINKLQTGQSAAAEYAQLNNQLDQLLTFIGDMEAEADAKAASEMRLDPEMKDFADEEEKDRHQAVVDPQQQRLGDLQGADLHGDRHVQ